MIYFHIFSPILGLGINVVCQVCYYRYVKNVSLLRSTFFGFLCGVMILLGIEAAYIKHFALSLLETLPYIMVNAISYMALGYCYFHFINLGETARRIRLLRELSESGDGLSMDEILQRYNAKEIVENRLNRLLKSGQIIYKDDRYYIGKPTMLFISQAIIFLKLLILGKKSEFD